MVNCCNILSMVCHWHLQVRGLSSFAVELDFLVEEYAASKGQFPPRQRQKRQSLYVATIEKANSLVNSLIEHGRIGNLGLVVVDEVWIWLSVYCSQCSSIVKFAMLLTVFNHLKAHCSIIVLKMLLNPSQPFYFKRNCCMRCHEHVVL